MKKKLIKKYSLILTNVQSAFVILINNFTENIINFKLNFSKYYPKVVIAYSYKTNYIPSLCKESHDLNCWAEVVSPMEVDFALKNLTNKSHIIYNGPIKDKDSIQLIIENNGIINIDCKEDLNLIDFNLNKLKSVKIAFRINISFDNTSSRFGMDLKELELVINNCLKINNIEIIGFHIHLPFRDLDSFDFRVDKLIYIISKYKNLNISYINIGGGFLGPLNKNLAFSLGIKSVPNFEDYAKLIGTKLSLYFKSQGIKKSKFPTLYLEPGSALVANALIFISKIHNIKKINNINYLVTYASRHLISPTNKTISLPVEIYNPTNKISKTNNYLVTGYTCIESDIIGEISTNNTISKKSFIIVNNVGSYSVVMGSNFILPQPSIYTLKANTLLLTREEISYSDIYNQFK
jgi:diaminopimelate decarboxylase